MSRIEELPDDFDESIDINQQPPETETAAADAPLPVTDDEPSFPINEERLKEMEQKDPLAPKMSQNMASVRTHTTDELADMLNKTPLFMTDISKAGDESETSHLPSRFWGITVAGN